MDYRKISDVAEEWGISPRRLQTLCAQGKIKGAARFGRAWMIPENAIKPLDGRKRHQDLGQCFDDVNMPMPRKTPFLYMTDLYAMPGTGEACVEALADNHEAQVLMAAELAYSRGQIDKVYQSANYLLEKHSGFYAVLSAGTLMALCAIWSGDIALWRKAKIHIAAAPATSDTDREIMALSIAAVDSMLYDTTSFPEWFKIGCFDPLHRDSLPAVRVFYAKYLYAAAYAVATKQLDMRGVQGLSLMSMLPFTVEPMISQSAAERSVISEAYLRMTCATIYHNSGNDERAVFHIDRAISLVLPDKLYGFLAEYCRVLGRLLEQRLCLIDPAAWEAVRKLHRQYNAGWSKLSGSIRGKEIATTLSPKEREVAKLAAFGMQNSEIAHKLNMSLSGVKQAVRIVSEKTGVSRDQFATIM